MDNHTDFDTAFRKAIHDLNGEIFLIRGHVELARASCPGGPVREQLDSIFDVTDSLSDLAKHMRELRLGLQTESSD